jgi:hypothetical protein
MKELVALASAAGKLNFPPVPAACASGGRTVKTDGKHRHRARALSWRGAPAVNDLLGQQVQMVFL